MKNQSYKICQSQVRQELEAEVNRSLNEGWEVAGGISVTPSLGGIWYVQAMLKSDRGNLVDKLKRTASEGDG
jgi:hypothetical protein